MRGNRLADSFGAAAGVQLDNRHAGSLRRCRLGEYPPLRPRAERGDHQRHREQQQTNPQGELDGSVARISHGIGSIAASADTDTSKSAVSGVHDSNRAVAVAVISRSPDRQPITTESPIRPPSNWLSTS